MISNASLRWLRLCGVVAVAAIIFASVMLPTAWEQLRTGHWALEHFFACFAATSIVSLGWHRPFIVAGAFGVIAAPLLEAVQSVEPTHSANLLSVVSGASGAFAATLVVSAGAFIAGRKQKAQRSAPACRTTGCDLSHNRAT